MTTVLGTDASTCPSSREVLFTGREIKSDRDRLHSEFLSMPALCLTVAQVARLLDVPVASASQLLAGLEGDGFVMRTASGRYRLAEPLIG